VNSNIKTPARAVKGKPMARFILRLGEMLTRQQLIHRMNISPSTLDKWEAAGLAAYGEGMKEKVYISDDVFAFLRTRPIRSK
jgi:hypothetical protein